MTVAMRTFSSMFVVASLIACAPVAPETPASDASEASPAPKPASRKAELLGEWVMAPPPGQERQVRLSRYALASPPNDDAFEAMNPTDQERNWYRDVKRLRDEEPGSPLLEQLKRKLEELQAVRVTFTEEKFVTTTQSGTQVTAYRIEEDLGSSVVILEEGDGPEEKRRAVIAFVDRDNIVINKGGVRIPMNRVAKGAAPPPSEAPLSPSAVSGRSAASGDRGSNDEYDRCVAEYFRCVEQMDPDTRASMADLLEVTKRTFEEARQSPERRRSVLGTCKQSVALAHATYCTK